MTPADLDELACTFGGLQPTNRSIGEKGHEHCNWPRVSADWGAVEQLVKALRGKGFLIEVQSYRNTIVRLNNGPWSEPAPDLPMALCLAVAEAARAKEGK